MSELPELHPDELAELRRMVGMELTNDEAQIFLRDKTIWDAWQDWLAKKNRPVRRVYCESHN